MKTANYTLIFHTRGGPHRSVSFTGTRREARAKGRELAKKDDDGEQVEGVQIRFHNYVLTGDFR